VKIYILASGSKGNAILVENNYTRILIDNGLSLKELKNRLKSSDVDPCTVSAILVTHEHSDHIKGVGAFARAYKIPIYLSNGTLMSGSWKLGNIDKQIIITAGKNISIGEFIVMPFSIPHDTAEPLAFTIHSGNEKLGIVTDLGYVPQHVMERIKDCSFLILESNHDLDMLLKGPYPWQLKQRIMGRFGHISNKTAASKLLDIVNPRLKSIVLAHLSQENNTPETALKASVESLSQFQERNFELSVALQDCIRVINSN
jgi:phosphoribosyl 1,2-cyclic phosphodiesterase